jgi:ABC-type branched-subunit amino acid transport system substrate-binding protein
MRRGALRGGVCGLAAAALALTACSSNSTPTTGSASPAAASGGSTAGSTAHGKPINLALLTEFTGVGTGGDSFSGAQAAIKYVNAHGGIHGRPLAIQECIDNDDPNLAAACAAKVANNPAIVAAVGQITLQGSVVDPVFQHAGLPAVGGFAAVPADFSSPVVFTPSIGGLSGLGAVAAVTDLLHGKKVSFVYSQSPAAGTEVALIDSVVLTPRKLPPMNAVAVAATAGDLSPAVAKAVQSSPDGIVLFTGQPQAASFVKAAHQQGVTTPIVISAGTESPSHIQQELGGGQNLYFDTFFNHSGRFYDAFLSQWQAAGNSPSLTDDFAINGWLSVTMFADIARTLPTVTRASVMRAYSKLSNYSTDGLTPPLSFDKPGTALGGQAPRIINPTIGLSQYQNGTLVPAAGGKFTNPFVVP